MGIRLDLLENVLSEKKWSQADLARRSGLSEHTIGRAVRNKEPLSEDSVNKISRALGRGMEGLSSTPVEVGFQKTTDHQVDPGRLRDAMAARGMNPTELATRTGLSVATISSMLRGLRTPTFQTIDKINRVVGKDVRASYSEDVSEEAAGVGIKVIAGQTNVVHYPEEDAQAAPSSGHDAFVKEAQRTRSSGPEDPLPTTQQDNQQLLDNSGSGEQTTLEELYVHVRQSRRMMAELLEQVIAIESQVGSAIAAATEGRNGTR
ncbi:helix-turn-helix domain-containing protein [Rubrobacter aplysinae]|uniref:helix-turn-helix domain-containing protein n=1 Tax=Rubrobacter aplysinae TaxID=909625 RepID=UPI00064C415F|nr:helix-turn-helix transcriptional regulator [Rubrobacter aplysinae]